MHALLQDIEAVPALTRFGRVARIEGLAVEVTGAQGAVSLGGQCSVTIGKNKKIPFLLFSAPCHCTKHTTTREAVSFFL